MEKKEKTGLKRICQLCNNKFKKRQDNKSKRDFCSKDCLWIDMIIRRSLLRKLEKYTQGEIKIITIKTNSKEYICKKDDSKR